MLPDDRGGKGIDKGRDIAGSDMRRPMKGLERGGTPACPESYLVWAQGSDGAYRVARRISL
jgi:hypothetical protein